MMQPKIDRVAAIFFTMLAMCPPVVASNLQAGFAEVDVTPTLDQKRPVFIAGFGHNRKATGVADPIMVRAFVLSDGKAKIAFAAIDVVGFFHANVMQVRSQLKGFDHVVVSSTHNHEGPDTLGLWGATAVTSGVDPAYLKKVEDGVVKAIQSADAKLEAAAATIGTKPIPELLRDAREPIILHDELVALKFTNPNSGKAIGAVVQWNCHPETLDDKNTKISADYVGYAVKEASAKLECPVVYLTGTVGGLMTSLKVKIQSEKGEELKDGTFEKTDRFGRLVAQAAVAALNPGTEIELTPFQIRRRELFLPCDNRLYLLGRQIGVLKRDAYLWSGDSAKAEPHSGLQTAGKRICMKSEIGWLRLGQLDIATIPGEIYPELVLDKVPDPAPKGADFPDAPVEPAIYTQLSAKYRMIIGLANDEIGYILPRRQWDEKPPYTYGNKSAPYGEINSLGPETGPLLCEAFRQLVGGK